MKIFIDAANIEQIAEYRRLGLICGVTTNPEICGQGAISANPVDLIKRIVAVMGDGHVFVQVVSRDPAQQLVGIKSIPRMVQAGLQVSATAVNSIGRAILAGKCGAHYMIPYYGWL